MNHSADFVVSFSFSSVQIDIVISQRSELKKAAASSSGNA
jgi:hypothetical protein